MEDFPSACMRRRTDPASRTMSTSPVRNVLASAVRTARSSSTSPVRCEAPRKRMPAWRCAKLVPLSSSARVPDESPDILHPANDCEGFVSICDSIRSLKIKEVKLEGTLTAPSSYSSPAWGSRRPSAASETPTANCQNADCQRLWPDPAPSRVASPPASSQRPRKPLLSAEGFRCVQRPCVQRPSTSSQCERPSRPAQVARPSTSPHSVRAGGVHRAAAAGWLSNCSGVLNIEPESQPMIVRSYHLEEDFESASMSSCQVFPGAFSNDTYERPQTLPGDSTQAVWMHRLDPEDARPESTRRTTPEPTPNLTSCSSQVVLYPSTLSLAVREEDAFEDSKESEQAQSSDDSEGKEQVRSLQCDGEADEQSVEAEENVEVMLRLLSDSIDECSKLEEQGVPDFGMTAEDGYYIPRKIHQRKLLQPLISRDGSTRPASPSHNCSPPTPRTVPRGRMSPTLRIREEVRHASKSAEGADDLGFWAADYMYGDDWLDTMGDVPETEEAPFAGRIPGRCRSQEPVGTCDVSHVTRGLRDRYWRSSKGLQAPQAPGNKDGSRRPLRLRPPTLPSKPHTPRVPNLRLRRATSA